jgi:SAM-dependent methyltransferase
MTENKIHWYDGWFYDQFIAPNQDKLFGQIISIIEPNTKIIDIGCGTGRFSFFVSDKSKSVLGIDLSKRNIERANHNLSNNKNNKMSFQHKSINEVISEGKEHFDYAVLTYVIHEVDKTERLNLLNEISEIADKIIIGDYLVNRPTGFWSMLNEAVEFAAGKDHYRNFKSYIDGNGILGLAEKTQLKVVKEIRNMPYTSHIAMLEK